MSSSFLYQCHCVCWWLWQPLALSPSTPQRTFTCEYIRTWPLKPRAYVSLIMWCQWVSNFFMGYKVCQIVSIKCWHFCTNCCFHSQCWNVDIMCSGRKLYKVHSKSKFCWLAVTEVGISATHCLCIFSAPITSLCSPWLLSYNVSSCEEVMFSTCFYCYVFYSLPYSHDFKPLLIPGVPRDEWFTLRDPRLKNCVGDNTLPARELYC
jgi:hypothetical protein